MLILALETTGDVCSVAVRDGDGLVAERMFRHRMHLSDRLHVDVDAVLAEAGATLQQVEAFAVGLGPGSFTGVRVGVTTVKTWADVLGRPVCGVSSLTALAEVCAGYEGVVVPVVRSRPGEVYAQPHRWAADRMEPLEPPATFTAEALADRVADTGPCLLWGPGLRRDGDALRAALAGLPVAFGRDDDPRASLAAHVAARRLAEGPGDDPLALVPLYVAPPPIGPPAKRTGAE